MKISVSVSQRLWKMRAHTATHLLHFQLDTLLDWTKQAWSLVDEDLLRFDFSSPRALEPHELETIQKHINHQIRAWYDVDTKEVSLQEAKKSWAKAFFEDKYWEHVRVVSIKWTYLSSVELCGWTHVSNTSHIWSFLITGQESVSSWVRRINAITGPRVAEYAWAMNHQSNQLAQLVGTQPAQLQNKINKILEELNHQAWQIESLTAQVATSYLGSKFPSNSRIDHIIHVNDTPLASIPRKQVVTIVKNYYTDQRRLLYTNEWNYAFSHPEAKAIAQEHSLKWWGAPNFVQGRDVNITTLAQY